VLDISGRVTGVGKLCVLFFSGSLIEGSHVCIFSVFLDIPAETFNIHWIGTYEIEHLHVCVLYAFSFLLVLLPPYPNLIACAHTLSALYANNFNMVQFITLTDYR
jgi:hypothetical protein